MPTSEVHSLSDRRRGRDSSGHEIYPVIERHSRTIGGRWRDKSGQRMKASERRPLTFCRAQRKGQVTTVKKR